MTLKSGTPGSPVVTGSAWYEQAGALGLGTAGLSLLAILSGSGTLAVSALGPVWPVFDIAAHATLHAFGAILGGFLALLLLWFGRAKCALVGLVASAVTTIAVPVVAASLSTWDMVERIAPAESGTVRLVSLNTWHSNPDMTETIAFLERVQADVIFLAEFGPPKTRWLSRLAKTYPHQVGCAHTYYCAVQILSRHPIVSSEILSRDKGTGPPSINVVFGSSLNNLRVIGVHLMRPIDSYRGNFREVTQIAGLAREAADQPIVVLGDFNLTGWSSNFAKFRRTSGLNHMGKFMPSWPAQPFRLPQLAIDHAFASKDITFQSVGLGPAVGSDHLPIIVDVRLPNSEAQ